ncbi:unnamed protein product [Caenorhabditis auriculariae]|uniref:Metalloendopeptidase n=1 Tax=Caenorhabditis auriculariae TaxID=2777116 RepID=A0A8S1GRW1_9PELO|nr:unnamed protein product [Caenorhabditis auriculariae]
MIASGTGVATSSGGRPAVARLSTLDYNRAFFRMKEVKADSVEAASWRESLGDRPSAMRLSNGVNDCPMRCLRRFILLLALASIPTGSALRAQRASRQRLQRIKQLINEDASRHQSLIQSDSVAPFDDVKRNPNATRNHDELSVNNADEYFQGDVDLSEHQVDIIEKTFDRGKREKRKVGRSPLYKKWDTARPISFDFADTIPSLTRLKIRDAMRLWQRHTCVRFEESGPNVDRLEFFDGGGCSSFVGRVGGTQGISIATPGCDHVGIISHEIGHALGIFHEQARPDQDRHISINYNNIPISRWNNFQAVGDEHADTFSLPYDTGSVMHYGPFGFAADPYTPTIRTLEKVQQSTIGQRAGPSFLDYQAINVAYGCYNHCGNLPCLRNGYPHPNNCSTCACPDGLSGQFCEMVKPSTALCGGVLFANKEAGYINSPHYPDYFPLNSECYWIIIAPAEGRVFLEFEEDFDFLCEDTCDKAYVEVKYHNDKRMTGARFCCSMLPRTRFISFKNEMIVLMRGFQSTSRGFRAKYWSNLGDATPIPILPSTEAHTISTEIRSFTLPFTTELPSTSTTTERTTTTTKKETTTTSTITTTSTETPTITQAPMTKTSLPTLAPIRSSTLSPVMSFTPPTLLPAIGGPIGGMLVTTATPDTINTVLECGCSDWSEWTGGCSQECGGCGHRLRTRECKKDSCRKNDKRPCNFKTCPEGTNFLINNAEFHILWRGCCVGLFRSGNECTALETDQNPFFKIINSLLSIQDPKSNSTLIQKRLMRGEH